MLGLGNILTKGGAVLGFPNKYSFNFDGNGDYLDCGASNVLVTGTNVTLSCWFKVDGTSRGYLIQNQKGVGSTNLTIQVNSNDSSETAGYVGAIIWRGTGHDFISFDGDVDDGAWHHLALTTTSSAQVLYLDGTSVATGSTTFTNASSTDSTLIGNDGGSNYDFDGLIDEVAIWDTALSASDVAKIASKPVDLSKPSKYATDRTANLKLWLRAGDKALPESDTAIARQDFYTDFDGTNDYVSVADTDDLSFGDSSSDTPFSITAWINANDITSLPILAKGTASVREYIFGFSSLDKLSFGCHDNSNASISINRTGTTTLTSFEGSWIHVAGTYDGSGVNSGIKLYINGASESTTDGSNGSYTAMHNLGEAVIGRTFSDGTNYADGKISNLAVYKTALDAQTIKQFAKSKFTPMRDNRFSVVDFDGSNDFIDISSSLTPSALTFTMWVATVTDSSYRTFIQCGDLLISKSNGNQVHINKSGVGGQNSTTSFVANEWTHIAVTADSSGTKVYRNGVLDLDGSAISFTAGDILIGKFTGGQFTSGSISSVAYYSSVKSAEEVYAIYQQGITYDESSLSGLVGYWRMGDDTSKAYPTIADSSSNSNDGTMTSMASDDIVQQMVAGYDLGAFESSSEELGANLVTNSTFDSDITGWSLNSADDNVSISQATVDGKICLDINDQSSNRRNAQFDLGGNAEDGEVYKISYYARKSQTGSTSKDFIVGLGFANVGADAGNVDKTVEEYDTWEFQEIHIVCGSANNYLQFLPTAYANDHIGRLFLDDVKVQKVLQSEVSDTYPAIIDVNEPVLGVEVNTVANATSPTNETNATTGWERSDTVNSTLEVVSNETYSGNYSLKFTATTAGDMLNTASTFTVESGVLYKVAITWKSEGTEANGFSMGWGTTKNGGDYVNQQVDESTDWVTTTNYIKTTTTTLGAFIHEGAGASDTKTIYIDSVTIKKVQGNVGTMTNQDSADLVYSSVLPDQSFLTGVNSAYNFIDLDGSNESINLDSFGFALDDYSAGAYSVWFYAQDQNPSSVQYIVSARDGETNTRMYIQIRSEGLRIAQGDTFSSYVSYSANQWNHILVSWSSGTATFYLNGSQADQFSFSTASGSNLFDFVLGGSYTSAGSFFDGYFGQFALWNKAQDSNVSNINTLGRHGNLLDSYADNLKMYLAMSALDAKTGLSDVGDGTIYDRSGNSNHGTATNTESADLKSSPNAEPNGYAKGDTNRSTTTP